MTPWRSLVQAVGVITIPLPGGGRGVYVTTVNHDVFGRRRWGVVLGVLLCASFASSAISQDRVVHLRNRSLTNAPSAVAPSLQVTAPPADGLFLVQFTGPVLPGWRETLADYNVRLLRYVPDDTFVARFSDTPVSMVEQLPFVHWVGEYLPAYRIHDSVLNQLRADPQTDRLEVRIQLSPAATANEVGLMGRRLSGVRATSPGRFGDILYASVSPRELAEVLRSPAVLWMEGPADMKLSDEISTKIVAGGTVSRFDGEPKTDMQKLGFDGFGVTVAVADSGLHLGRPSPMHPDLVGRANVFFYYGDLLDASDEHAHGTHVTGIIAGSGAGAEEDDIGARYGLGVAPGVEIVTQRIFDGLGAYEAPDSFAQLVRDAVRSGADIGSNSWGEDAQGRYDLTAAEFDGLVRDGDIEVPGDQPYILEFSAGNAGPLSQTINSPGVAKNVIATGASQNDRTEFFLYADGSEAMADFSSRGPAEDGRIKPDLVAPGTWIASAQTAATGSQNAWGEISARYQYQGGTSQSGPHVSGAAAIFVQYFRTMYGATPSPAMVKAALINSAWDMLDDFGTSATPNNDEGWGRVDLPNLIGAQRQYLYSDQEHLLQTGQAYDQTIVVNGSVEPLVITLTYTDVPGLPAAVPALVNDLNLELVDPRGKVYRGNQFDSFGISSPNAPRADRLNNVEGIYIDEPMTGSWQLTVRANNVADDARVDTIAIDQDFALVVSGELPLPGVSVVVMDRAAYRAPSTINLRVLDFDIGEETSVPVSLSSSTEGTPFNVQLQTTGTPGVFTGAVDTATGPAVAGDGVLQIAHNDQITARYADTSAQSTHLATARGDFVAPQITGITLTNRLGRTFVIWRTDERTEGEVYFGQSIPPTNVATDDLFSLAHEIEMPGLMPDENYFASFSATDEAGNVAIYDNGGNYLQFVAPVPAAVLFVDAYAEPPPGGDAEIIPPTGYTMALDQTGISYDTWDVFTSSGVRYPTLSDLEPFDAVVWRVNDDVLHAGAHFVPPTEQNTLRQYLDSGGGLFLASMEILSWMGEVDFRTNVLQVAEFTPNPDQLTPGCPDCDEDHQVPYIIGEDLDPVSDGVFAELDYAAFPIFGVPGFLEIGPDLSDTFLPTAEAVTIFTELDGRPCGIRYPRTGQDGNGRVVFFSFPLDAIPLDGTPSGRAAVMEKSLRFLVAGIDGRGNVALDRPEYTPESTITFEVADSDLIGQETVEVTLLSSSDPVGITAVGERTTRRSLFRGTARLAPPGAAGPDLLAAEHGDVIRIRYNDESHGTSRETIAFIDAIAPELSNLEVEPLYTDVTFRWEASEFVDATVQVGESAFFDGHINRTVSGKAFDVTHELTMSNLDPATQYYYRIISRDVAGNEEIIATNNQGEPLSFTTLVPVTPPWLDGFETETEYDWDVFSAEESQLEWERGTPPGGGHDGSSIVWATNLRRQAQDYQESFLISPPVSLVDGNRATLRFWHDYDFTDFDENLIIEFGQLLLFTNTTAPPIEMTFYFSDGSFGWEEQEFDLSPYVGNTVYVVYYYASLSIGSVNRYGWKVDDVSIEMSTIDPAVLMVTNNLAHSTFNIVGPINRAAHPWVLYDTNAPPGDYTVTYNSVPYYKAPTAQSFSLSSGETRVIQGDYTIIDSNENEIADAWENQYFGGVNPQHGADIDTDGDGLSDLDEFMAGTNPTNAVSVLKLPMPLQVDDFTLKLEWPAMPGRAYRLDGTTNFADWFTLLDWYRSRSNSGTHLMTLPTNTATGFRVLVRP